jgi:hypothetical protein
MTGFIAIGLWSSADAALKERLPKLPKNTPASQSIFVPLNRQYTTWPDNALLRAGYSSYGASEDRRIGFI